MRALYVSRVLLSDGMYGAAEGGPMCCRGHRVARVQAARRPPAQAHPERSGALRWAQPLGARRASRDGLRLHRHRQEIGRQPSSGSEGKESRRLLGGPRPPRRRAPARSTLRRQRRCYNTSRAHRCHEPPMARTPAAARGARRACGIRARSCTSREAARRTMSIASTMMIVSYGVRRRTSPK
jgi:hypothetical protein